MRLACLAFVAGAWCLQQQAVLANSSHQLLGVLVSLLLLGLSRRLTQVWIRTSVVVCAAFLAGFVWSAWRAELRLADELPKAWEVRDLQIVGTVARLPDHFERGTRFAFDVEEVETPGAKVPEHLLLSWYSGWSSASIASTASVPQVRPGERWRLTVRLRRPHGNANPDNFDYEFWLLEQGIRATGYIRASPHNQRLDAFVWSLGHVIEAWRWRLRSRIENAFAADLKGAQYTGVLVALVVGDQRAIAQSDWQIFNRTGINHLISISGLHVTMLAGFAAWLAFALWRGLARHHAGIVGYCSAYRFAAGVGVGVALVYCLIAGFGVPAQRTLYMLSTVALALWLGRMTAPSNVLSLALLVVVLIDPWAVMSPGFCLSFMAVALIFYVTTGRVGQQASLLSPGQENISANSDRQGIYSWWIRLRDYLKTAAHIQWAITLGLLPVTMLLFQQISLIGPVANAIAIPLVSLIVTPLALLGALLPGVVGNWVLQIAHQLIESLAALLTWMSALPFAVWSSAVPPAWVLVIAMLGVIWCLAPRAIPLRFCGLWALIPALFWPTLRVAPGQVQLTALDVGQGMALLIETHTRRYLYDTGPVYGPEVDSGSRVILPYLRARGIDQLDGMIVSHNDNDHSGGALSILKALPVSWVASSLALDSPIVQQAKQALRCAAGQTWMSDGVQFSFVHPQSDSYANPKLKPNARTCVLRIQIGDTLDQRSVLLTGDIERAQELEIMRRTPQLVPADVLLVPHHGSATSSSEAFLDAVRPRVALLQAGYLNHFGHPRANVLERYTRRGIALYRTDWDGAVTLDLSAVEITIDAYRRGHARYWYGR